MSDIVSNLKKIKSNLEYQTDDTYLLNTQNKEKDLDKLLHDLDNYQTYVKFNDKIVQQKKTLKKIKKEIKKQKKQVKSNKHTLEKTDTKIPVSSNIDEKSIKKKFLSSDYKPRPYGSYKKKYKKLNNTKNQKQENKEAESENQDTESENQDTKSENQDTDSENQDTDSENHDTDSENHDTESENHDTDSENHDTDSENHDTDSENQGTDLEKIEEIIKPNLEIDEEQDEYIEKKERNESNIELDDETKNILNNMDELFKGGTNINNNSNLLFYTSFIPIIGGLNFVFSKENYTALIYNNNMGLLNFFIFIFYHILCVIEIFAVVYLILNIKNKKYLYIVIFIIIIRIICSLLINKLLKNNKINNNKNIENIELYLEKINNILINPNIKLNNNKKNKIKTDLKLILNYHTNINNKYYFLNKFISSFTLLFPFVVFIILYLINRDLYLSIIITMVSLFLIISYTNICMMYFNTKKTYKFTYIFANIIEKVIIFYIAYHTILITSDKYLKHLDFNLICSVLLKNCLTIFN